MFQRVLIAAAVMVASPAIVSAQDIFWSFSSTSVVTSAVAPAGTVLGTAYVFTDGLFAVDAIDLNFTTSDPDVLQITGGTAINPTFNSIGGTRFDESTVTADGDGGGNLFAVNVIQNGINPATGPSFDPEFNANIGPNGAALLAEVNFNIVGAGTAILDFGLGTQGAIAFTPGELPPIAVVDPSFESATLVVDIPEPSSASLLILGSVGLIARRKRA